MLKRLDPTARTMLAQVGQPRLAAVLAAAGSGACSLGWRWLWLAVALAGNLGWRRCWLPRLPKGVTVRLRLREYCTSPKRLAWAKANGCPWGVLDWSGTINPCALAAAGGHLEVLQWAREHDCPWDFRTCYSAAEGGHLEVLKWALEHHCPWGAATCAAAAQSGHLEVFKWAREQHCPWDHRTRHCAAEGGHLKVLLWLDEQGRGGGGACERHDLLRGLGSCSSDIALFKIFVGVCSVSSAHAHDRMTLCYTLHGEARRGGLNFNRGEYAVEVDALRRIPRAELVRTLRGHRGARAFGAPAPAPASATTAAPAAPAPAAAPAAVQSLAEAIK